MNDEIACWSHDLGSDITHFKLWGIRSRTEKSWSIWCPGFNSVNGLVNSQFLISMRRSKKNHKWVSQRRDWVTFCPSCCSRLVLVSWFSWSVTILLPYQHPGVLLLVAWPAVSGFNWFPLLLSVFFLTWQMMMRPWLFLKSYLQSERPDMFTVWERNLHVSSWH